MVSGITPHAPFVPVLDHSGTGCTRCMSGALILDRVVDTVTLFTSIPPRAIPIGGRVG